MSKQTIGIGSVANDGTGDTLRDAMDKVNDNFIELYGPVVAPVSGRYIPIDRTRTIGVGTASGGAGRIKFTPFIVRQPITLSSMVIIVSTTSGTATLQGCIYNVGGSSGPAGTLVGNTGTFATNATTRAEALFSDGSGSNVSLNPGIYLAGLQYSDTTAVACGYTTGAAASADLLGGVPALADTFQSATSQGFRLIYAGTFGTFPDLSATAATAFGAGTTVEEPAFWLKNA